MQTQACGAVAPQCGVVLMLLAAGTGLLLESNSKAPIETSEFNTNPNNSLPETQTGIFDLFDR